MTLYLVLYDKEIKMFFTKYFQTEHDMDKFKNKLKYSKKLFVIEDSRDNYYLYHD